jgi:hypothetical protein
MYIYMYNPHSIPTFNHEYHRIPSQALMELHESRHGLVSKASQEQAQELMFAELLRMEMVTVYTMKSHDNPKKTIYRSL